VLARDFASCGGRIAAKLQLGCHLSGERAQRLQLAQLEPPGHLVHHAESAERKPVRRHEGSSGIEADAGLNHHVRVVDEARVGPRVIDDEQAAAEYRVRAERLLP
jgi:hypothetical protein